MAGPSNLSIFRRKVVSAGIVLVGYVAPAYNNYKSIQKDDDPVTKYWGTYWVIFALFVSLEWLFDLLISWLPFYHEAKLLFVLALWHPKTRLAETIFKQFIGPFLSKHEAGIDKFFEESKLRLADVASTQAAKHKGYLVSATAAAGERIKQVQAKAMERANLARANGTASTAKVE